MTIKVSVCEQCGDVFDATGYPVCPDCQYEHTYIKIDKEKPQGEPTWQPNLKTK